MKKQKSVILFLLLNIVGFGTLKAQLQLISNYACTSNGNTHTALDTYWHYRYRLTHYFMKMGSKQGMSIPADIRNTNYPVSNELGSQIKWTDGLRTLSWYIETLATEYSLLANNQQSTDETVMELYYALHALFRMDSTYVVCATGGGGSGCAICTGNYSTNSFPFPGYGIMPPDDIGGNNIPVTLEDPLNANLINTVTIGSQQYLTTAFMGNTTPFNGHNIFNGSSAFGIPVIQGGLPVSEVGDGIVGPIAILDGNNPCAPTVASQDNYMAVLIALAVIKELIPSNVFSFSECQNPAGPYGYNLGPSQMAQELAQAILYYVWNESQLNLVGCDGNYLATDINQSDFTDYWFWPYYPPWVGICGDFNFSPSYTIPYLPPLLGASLDLIPLIGPLINNDFLINPSVIWDNFTPCNALNLGCATTTLELAEMGAVMGNDGGPYNTACDMISVDGTLGAPGCSKCSGNEGVTQATGWDMYYGALYNLIWGGQCSSVDLCSMQNLINSAPWDGPYNHSGGLGLSPIDFASCGWASSRRFATNQDGDFSSTADGYSGNFNGLDYMLFYNLYCIMSNRATSQTTYVPTGCEYPYQYPITNCIFNPNAGTIAYPFNITSNNCSPIIVTKLNVQSGGGLILNGGITSYVDLNPSSGNITVNSGGFMDASCTYNCCTILNNSYVFETDPEGTNDLAPVRRTTTDTINYKVNNEFSPKPNYDAISNYPNPFNNQTTFSFEIKETTPVTISIYDLNEQKVIDVFTNQTYNQGSYAQAFNSSNLSSGSYIAVMITKDDRKTIKIVKD